ncbi:MAG: hypothetical protein M1826_001842 [Phylliscum demangeonii]|nr:MAG: hypothetical protein M1826_001842 [Phylliscum demangeonii]
MCTDLELSFGQCTHTHQLHLDGWCRKRATAPPPAPAPPTPPSLAPGAVTVTVTVISGACPEKLEAFFNGPCLDCARQRVTACVDTIRARLGECWSAVTPKKAAEIRHEVEALSIAYRNFVVQFNDHWADGFRDWSEAVTRGLPASPPLLPRPRLPRLRWHNPTLWMEVLRRRPSEWVDSVRDDDDDDDGARSHSATESGEVMGHLNHFYYGRLQEHVVWDDGDLE